jgi:outer membrane protein assembly factor BamB
MGTTAPGGGMAAMRASDGSLRWRYTNSKAGCSRPAVGVDAVFASADNATVCALRRDTGTLLWISSAAETEISPPTLSGSVLYVAIGTSLVALGGRTGQPR